MAEILTDQEFPQVALALSTDFMRTFLQLHWLTKTGADDNLLIESCEVDEKRYKPGKHFQLAYRLRMLDRFTRQQQDQIISARLLTRSQQADFVNLSEDSLISANGLPAFCFAPELAMMIWTFPHDRKLANLSRLHDRTVLPEYFNSHPACAGLSSAMTVQAVDYRVLHYLPEKSCMTEYRLTISVTETGAVERLEYVYGKTYADDSGRRTYGYMRQIAAQNPHCAYALGYDEESKVLWQGKVPGIPLTWHANLPHSTALIVNLGKCIAALHRCVVDAETTYGFEQIFKQLDAANKLIKHHHADLAGRVAAISAGLHSAYENIHWPTAKAPLHMDLKMGNLLVEGDAVALIDMDGICLGHPLIDIGSFIANVYLNGLRAGADEIAIGRFVNRFIASYARFTGWPVDNAQLAWYISAALIHEVLRRSIKQQDEARLQISETIVKISERYLTQTFDSLPAVMP